MFSKPIDKLLIKCDFDDKDYLDCDDFDAISKIIPNKNVKNVIIQSEKSIEIDINLSVFQINSLTLPDKTKDIYIYEDLTDYKLQELNFKNINIMDYYHSKREIDIISIRILAETINNENVNEKDKEDILKIVNSDDSSIKVYERCLKYPDVVNNVYRPSLGLKLINNMSEAALNSDCFYDFIKNKEIAYNSIINNVIYNITRADLLNKLYPPYIIIKNLNKIDDKIKYNKDFILNLMKRDKESSDKEKSITRCPLANFDSVLSYFKDDENIVGFFAEKLLINDFSKARFTLKEFLSIINKDDKETIFWLAANNINFYLSLSKEEFEEYVIAACSSYNKIHQIKEYEYTISSEFNVIHINYNPVKDKFFVTIKDWYSFLGGYKVMDVIISSEFSKDAFLEMYSIIHDIQEEYKKINCER
jgi:hypothetical protein